MKELQRAKRRGVSLWGLALQDDECQWMQPSSRCHMHAPNNCLPHPQIPSDVHIIVAPDDPDSIAAVLLAKAQELQQLEAAAAVAGDAPAPAGAAGSGAAAGAGPGGVIVVVASHGRPRLEVSTSKPCDYSIRAASTHAQSLLKQGTFC